MKLPDRLMVGQRPLEASILVRIQVRQPAAVKMIKLVHLGRAFRCTFGWWWEIWQACQIAYHFSFSEGKRSAQCQQAAGTNRLIENKTRLTADFVLFEKIIQPKEFATISKALKREAEIKSWKRAKKLSLIKNQSWRYFYISILIIAQWILLK